MLCPKLKASINFLRKAEDFGGKEENSQSIFNFSTEGTCFIYLCLCVSLYLMFFSFASFYTPIHSPAAQQFYLTRNYEPANINF